MSRDARMKVVAFPSDETACSWQRVYLPLHFARAQGLLDAQFAWKPDEIACGTADVVLYQRHYMPEPLAWWREMLRWRRTGHQAPALVWEMDDDVWAIPDSNPFKRFYTVGVLSAIDEMVATADLAIVPSKGLAAVVATKTAAPVRIIPSGLDPAALTLRRAPGDGRTIRIGYAASDTHNDDLAQCANALRRVLTKRPHVQLVLKGVLARGVLDDLPQSQVVRETWETFGSAYYPNLAALAIDIWIAPLKPMRFNYSKAAVKILEAFMLRTPIICSPVGIYADVLEHGTTGLFASTPAGWEDALLQLIDDAALRHAMGEAGHDVVKAFTYDTLAPQWAAAFDEAVSLRQTHARP